MKLSTLKVPLLPSFGTSKIGRVSRASLLTIIGASSIGLVVVFIKFIADIIIDRSELKKYCDTNNKNKDCSIIISANEFDKLKTFTAQYTSASGISGSYNEKGNKIIISSFKGLEAYSRYKVMTSMFHPLRKEKYENIKFIPNDNPVLQEFKETYKRLPGIQSPGKVISKANLLTGMNVIARKEENHPYPEAEIMVSVLDETASEELQEIIKEMRRGNKGTLDYFELAKIGGETFISHRKSFLQNNESYFSRVFKT